MGVNYCTMCKRHGVFFNFYDSDVCEDCEAKAELEYSERVDFDYWHSDEVIGDPKP